MIEEILLAILFSLCGFITLIWGIRELHGTGWGGLLWMLFIVPLGIAGLGLLGLGLIFILEVMLSVPYYWALGTADTLGFFFTVYLLQRWKAKTHIRAWYWRNFRKRELEELQRQRQQEETRIWSLRRLQQFEAGLLLLSSCVVCDRRLNSTRTQRKGLCYLHIDQFKVKYNPETGEFYAISQFEAEPLEEMVVPVQTEEGCNHEPWASEGYVFCGDCGKVIPKEQRK